MRYSACDALTEKTMKPSTKTLHPNPLAPVAPRPAIALALALLATPLGALAQVQSDAQATRAEQQAALQAEQARRQAEIQEGQAEFAAKSAAAAALPGQYGRARAPTEAEELALAALEGLIAAPSERALPLLKRVLSGNQSDLVKSRALFVLSQSGAPEAETILLETAKRGSPALRAEAVRMIGIGGRPEGLAALQSMYPTAPDLREDIRQAFMIAGNKKALFDLATKASPEEAAEIVHLLGAMGAVDELRQLGKLGKHSEQLVQAYAVSGDLDSLSNLAKTSADRAIRLEAIRNIGIIDRREASQALSEIYRSSEDAEVKETALQGLMIAGDEQALMALYRAASKPAEKRAILRMLTMIGGDAAIDAIDAALQGKSP
jgi:HEAT repeat protein